MRSLGALWEITAVRNLWGVAPEHMSTTGVVTMTDEKALQLANLIKSFGQCMSVEDPRDHLDVCAAFNHDVDAFLNTYNKESVTTLAAYITRAIDPHKEDDEPINTEVFARVLPDLMYVRSLDIQQDLAPRREVS